MKPIKTNYAEGVINLLLESDARPLDKWKAIHELEALIKKAKDEIFDDTIEDIRDEDLKEGVVVVFPQRWVYDHIPEWAATKMKLKMIEENAQLAYRLSQNTGENHGTPAVKKMVKPSIRIRNK